MVSVVENAQQEPHCPWSLTSVTAPLSLQSRSVAVAANFLPPLSFLMTPSWLSALSLISWSWAVLGLKVSIFLLNSSSLMSENLVTPKLCSSSLAFLAWARLREASKLALRLASSSACS